MDEIINLLSCIVATMETISVVGIDNQDKFVGCANAIKTAIRELRAEQVENAAIAKTDTVKEETNG